MKWLITGDWQIDRSNLEYCHIAHKQELSIIKEHGITGHIDLGDMKDMYNPIDGLVYDFAMERAENIQKAVNQSIRLMGNHDRYSQSNDSANWLKNFNRIGGNNVTKPRILTLGKIDFFCLPYSQDKSDTIAAALKFYKTKLNNKNKRVLLFHCDVQGALYDNLQKRESKSAITLNSLKIKSYDMCFGGHIHKHQMLANNCMYVGNPFATDMGEIDQPKVFIVWDDATNQFYLIPSAVPGLYSWQYIKANEPKNLPEGTRIKQIVECSASEDYHEKLSAIADKIEKSYPDCISYVVPRFTIQNSSDDVVVDPHSSDYNKIKSFVRAVIPEELRTHRHKMLEYLASTLASVEGHSVSQHSGKIYFDSVIAKNVLSFKHVEYDYRKRGIVLIKGDNKDVSRFNSIGAGKTNFLSLPSVALFGQTFKKQKNDAWASDDNEKKSVVELTLHNDTKSSVTVKRSRRPAKLRMFVNGRDDSSGLRNNTKKGTQGNIERFLGYTYDTFYKAVYIDQSLSNAFLHGTNSERSNLIHQFQNLERFNLAQKLVSKEQSFLKQRITELETKQSMYEENLKEAIDDLHSRQKVKQQNLKQLKKTWLLAESKYGKHNRDNVPRMKNLQEREGLLEERRDAIRSKENSIKNKIVASSDRIDDIVKELERIASIKICGTCLQKLSPNAKKIIAVKAKKRISEERATLQDLTDKLAETRLALTNKVRALKYINEAINTIDINTQKLSRWVEKSKSAYEAVRDAHKTEESSIIKAQERIDKLKHKLKLVNKALKDCAEEDQFLQFAYKAFSRDGLPSFLSNLVVPVLNKAAQRYSKLFIDGEIQVMFDLHKGHITPRVINTHGGKTLQSQSTGEKAWAGIITSFALREISHPTNLLILDEPGHGLDSESAKTFGRNLLKLKSMFETVLVVTHDLSIASALEGEGSVTVVKKNKISSLILK